MNSQEQRPRELWLRAKYPHNKLAGEYGRPVHPLVVTIPIGVWFASLIFDVGSRIGGPGLVLSVASYWLIGIGIVTAIVASVLGFYDLLQVPAGTHVMRLGLLHMGLNLTAITFYIGDFLIRWSRGGSHAGVPAGLIVLSAVAYTLLAVSGHLGGLLAYRWGVRVAAEPAQRKGYGAAA